jgi:hypothetical protein
LKSLRTILFWIEHWFETFAHSGDLPACMFFIFLCMHFFLKCKQWRCILCFQLAFVYIKKTCHRQWWSTRMSHVKILLNILIRSAISFCKIGPWIETKIYCQS